MKKMKKRNSYNILSTLILVLAAVTVLFPLIWVAFTSLKSSQECGKTMWKPGSKPILARTL